MITTENTRFFTFTVNYNGTVKKVKIQASSLAKAEAKILAVYQKKFVFPDVQLQ